MKIRVIVLILLSILLLTVNIIDARVLTPYETLQEKYGIAFRETNKIKIDTLGKGVVATERVTGNQENIGKIIVGISEAAFQRKPGLFQEKLGLTIRDIYGKNISESLLTVSGSQPEIIGLDNPEYYRFTLGASQVRPVIGHYLIPIFALASFFVLLFSIGNLPGISKYAYKSEEEETKEEVAPWKIRAA